MVLTSSLGELMEDQMLQHCKIVLNIHDRAFIYRNIYIILHGSVCDPGFHAFCIFPLNPKCIKPRVTDPTM